MESAENLAAEAVEEAMKRRRERAPPEQRKQSTLASGLSTTTSGSGSASSGQHVMFADDDLPFEEELLRNPQSLKAWTRYLAHRSSKTSQAASSPREKWARQAALNMVYERALKELPGSYKLWYNYLKTRRQQVRPRCITDPGFEEVNCAFERALVFMHKMPRIWLDYTAFLMEQRKITRLRRVFDRALRALPITQHERIWKPYVEFVKSHPGIEETAVRVYRRYLQLCPEDAEGYVEYLVSVDRLDEAAVLLGKIVNNQDFASKRGKSNHAMW